MHYLPIARVQTSDILFWFLIIFFRRVKWMRTYMNCENRLLNFVNGLLDCHPRLVFSQKYVPAQYFSKSF